jgi:transcriptional regulator with XRE-family HTH domain
VAYHFTQWCMETIKQIRDALGLSQAELADKLGVHQSTISRMENGGEDKRTLMAARTLLPAKKRSATL